MFEELIGNAIMEVVDEYGLTDRVEIANVIEEIYGLGAVASKSFSDLQDDFGEEYIDEFEMAVIEAVYNVFCKLANKAN